MRKQICLVILAIGILPLHANSYDYLWVYSSAEASPQSYALDDIQKITFGAEAMNLHLLGQPSTVAVNYGSSVKITFENEAVNVKGVLGMAGISVNYDATAATLNVKSPVPMKSVYVYNTQGQPVKTFGQTGPSTEISLNSLPSGIYIVRADNGQETKTIKIVKH